MDANDIKTKDTIKFREYLKQGDFYYQQNDIDSAIKNYLSALKIDNKNYNILLNIYIKFSVAKISNCNKKIMKEICLFFLEQNNICYSYGFNNFLEFTIYNENKDYIENSKHDKCYKFNDKLISILNDKIFQLILKRCLVVDSDLEEFLTQIRKNLLVIYTNKKRMSLRNFTNF